jgi:hypothetical protein
MDLAEISAQAIEPERDAPGRDQRADRVRERRFLHGQEFARGLNPRTGPAFVGGVVVAVARGLQFQARERHHRAHPVLLVIAAVYADPVPGLRQPTVRSRT